MTPNIWGEIFSKMSKKKAYSRFMRDFCPNFLLDLLLSDSFLCFLLFLTIKPLSAVDEFIIKKATFSAEITFATLYNYFSSIQLTLPLGALTIFSMIFFFFLIIG